MEGRWAINEPTAGRRLSSSSHSRPLLGAVPSREKVEALPPVHLSGAQARPLSANF